MAILLVALCFYGGWLGYDSIPYDKALTFDTIYYFLSSELKTVAKGAIIWEALIVLLWIDGSLEGFFEVFFAFFVWLYY